MALATDLAQGTIMLTADLHGSSDPYAPELTPTGVVPGQYVTPSVVVDQKGRVLYIQNNAIDLPCASATNCGGVKIPTTGHINLSAGQISLPTATTGDYGVVRAGSGFSITNGTLTNTDPVPEATVDSLGYVIVPESGNLDIDVSGNVIVPVAGISNVGVISVPGGDGLSVDGAGALTYTLPIATGLVLGGVKEGSGFIIQPDGTIDVDYDVATSTTVGLIKVPGGDGLSVDGGGTLTYTPVLQAATTTTLGSVIVPVSGNIDIDGSGNITARPAETFSLGVVQSADTNNVTITSGNVDIGPNVVVKDTPNVFTSTQKGVFLDIGNTTGSFTPNFNSRSVQFFTLTGNVTFNNPSGTLPGGIYTFILKQDTTGGRTATWGSNFKFKELPVLSTTPNAIDMVTMVAIDSTTIYCQLHKNFS